MYFQSPSRIICQEGNERLDTLYGQNIATGGLARPGYLSLIHFGRYLRYARKLQPPGATPQGGNKGDKGSFEKAMTTGSFKRPGDLKAHDNISICRTGQLFRVNALWSQRALSRLNRKRI